MKARERQCIVWLCVTCLCVFYLIVENCGIIIIIKIKNVGDQCWWNVSFVFIWNLVIHINPFGVKHPTEQCGMLALSFLHFFICRCHSWGSTSGVGRTSECPMRFWSGLMECSVFVMLAILGLVLTNFETIYLKWDFIHINLLNCELLFLDFNDNYYIWLLLSSG